MSRPLGDSIEEVFIELSENEAFREAERKVKPYYDLVLQIIKRRSEMGLTQKDLAERAHTHQSRISKIESAEHDIRLSTLIEIAEALETEVSICLIPLEDHYVKAENYKKLFITISSQNIQNYVEAEVENVRAIPQYL